MEFTDLQTTWLQIKSTRLHPRQRIHILHEFDTLAKVSALIGKSCGSRSHQPNVILISTMKCRMNSMPHLLTRSYTRGRCDVSIPSRNLDRGNRSGCSSSCIFPCVCKKSYHRRFYHRNSHHTKSYRRNLHRKKSYHRKSFRKKSYPSLLYAHMKANDGFECLSTTKAIEGACSGSSIGICQAYLNAFDRRIEDRMSSHAGVATPADLKHHGSD